ncbi:putative capsular polysaccharide synthesis family protein [Vibrio breoganii]
MPISFKNLHATYEKYKSCNVLIYQMGKVGSTSLERSITKSVHLHTLFSNSECSERQRQLLFLYPIKEIKNRIYQFVKRLAIRQKKEVKIISLVREPVSRNTSMYFQHFPYWYCKFLNENNDGLISRNDGNDIVKLAFETSFDHNYFNSWFDKEVKKLTGIDIFKYEFDKNKGYTVINKGKYKLLLLTMENVNKCYENGVIQQFIAEEFTLNSSNVSENKWYSEIMKDFKNNYAYDIEYVNKMHNSKTAKHFYDDVFLEKKKQLIKLERVG